MSWRSPRGDLGRSDCAGGRHAAQAARPTGPKSLAGFGSPRAATRKAYLFQKWCGRLRQNNVDHCTRLCHASSVAALLEGKARVGEAIGDDVTQGVV